jgi:thymidylate synthase
MGNLLDVKYKELVNKILTIGEDKDDRTGTGTISLFGPQLEHDMCSGFPLLTSKQMAFKTMKTELFWFLAGGTNIQPLVQKKCYIWVGDAYKNYLKNMLDGHPLTQEEFIERIKLDDVFAGKWGELGPIYGKQWRDWSGIDQILELLYTLRDNPNSRRMIVSAWNVGELNDAVLPPCHTFFQCHTTSVKFKHIKKWAINQGFDPDVMVGIWKDDPEGKVSGYSFPTRAVSLKWYQRSVDVGLGLPFNIASYALLLEMIADEVNMVADRLIGTFGDTHIYSNHVEGLSKQLTNPEHPLPTIKVNGLWDEKGIQLLNYNHSGKINLPLSN